MSTKSSPKPRPRKRQSKDELISETVAPVHKPIKNEINHTESVQLENKPEIETSSESNRTFILEDRTNVNLNKQNSFINRDISIESELQINTKIEKGIIGFMETEIKKEKSKYTHFTDSRPQSLSFYEEEKAPEELSGQLEQLSPEEKRVLKRRKEERKIDIELDASTYKEIQNVLNREKEDQLLAGIMKSQKSKSRKKKQFDSEESLAGIGDSREQMIPSGKRKTKKSKSKSKESSPLPGSSHKKKHRKRDEHDAKTDITVALEDLQDDVFDKDPNDVTYQYDAQMKGAPKSNTIYVQKRNGFETAPRDRLYNSIGIDIGKEDNIDKRFAELMPIELAMYLQKNWLPFTVLCHGLLAGLSLAHCIVTHSSVMSDEFVKQYQIYAEPYSAAFSFLCIICVISVFDRFDIKQVNCENVVDWLHNRRSFVVIFIYILALIIHFINAPYDDYLSNLNYFVNSTIVSNVSVANSTSADIVIDLDELQRWNLLSMWRSLLAITGWIIIALSSNEDMLYSHLSSMERYLLNPA